MSQEDARTLKNLPDFRLLIPDPTTEEAHWLPPDLVEETHVFFLRGEGVTSRQLILLRILKNNRGYDSTLLPYSRLNELARSWGYSDAQVEEVWRYADAVNKQQFIERCVNLGTLKEFNWIDAGMAKLNPKIEFLKNRLMFVTESTKIVRDIGPMRGKKRQ
jgi:hypothetical protein